MRGDKALVKIVEKIGGDGKPAEPAKPFTLPSQRKSGTPMWKVLILMLVLGTAGGLYTCHMKQQTEGKR
jgi:hypothetical protein